MQLISCHHLRSPLRSVRNPHFGLSEIVANVNQFSVARKCFC